VTYLKRALSVALIAGLLLAAAPVGVAAPGDPVPEIVGGTEVPPGAYPFMAALVWSDTPNAKSGLRCGATILDAEWILTAAHCTDTFSAGDFDVVMGRDTLTSTDGERIGVAEIHEHPGFDDWTLENDIALLKLQTPASVGEPVFWATEVLAYSFEPTTVATTAGWGLTENSPVGTLFGVQDNLREVDVPIRTTSECSAAYPGEFFEDSMVCAGYPAGGMDSCSGDSGGPLFVAEGDRWRQVGIVSWGYGCADPGDYGVYSRIATYDSWILSTTGFTACEGAVATIVGTSGDDRLLGTSGADVIHGEGGNDTLRGRFGDDILCGGAGDDHIYAGGDDDIAFGGPGHDWLFGSTGTDVLDGGGGNDQINGGAGDDIVYGGFGQDWLYGRGGSDVLYGGGDNDQINGGPGHDVVSGGPGDDVIRVYSGYDRVDGDGGADTIYGGTGNDDLRGQSGDDEIWGGADNDQIDGGVGIDTLNGGFGTDTCTAGEVGLIGCETIL